MSPAERAAALDRRLAPLRAAGPEAAAPPPEAPELDELLTLAASLGALAPQLDPPQDFRDRLSAVLAAAPRPTSLAETSPMPTTAVVHDLDAGLSELAAGEADLAGLLARRPDTAGEL